MNFLETKFMEERRERNGLSGSKSFAEPYMVPLQKQKRLLTKPEH